jgi:hypothetical protein
VSYTVEHPNFSISDLSSAIKNKFQIRPPTNSAVKRWISKLRWNGLLARRPKTKLSPTVVKLIQDYIATHPRYRIPDIAAHLQSQGIDKAVYNSVKRWTAAVLSMDHFQTCSAADEIDVFVLKFIMSQRDANDAAIASQVLLELKRGRGPPVIMSYDDLLQLVARLRLEVTPGLCFFHDSRSS